MPGSSIELKIEGMSCDHCKRAVERAVSQVRGVDSVVVDLQLGKAIVAGTFDQSALIAAVEDEGYTAQIISSSNHHG